ncbi:MAG: lytic transglycosylase domain-containing protein [Rhodanobacter sp.]
MLPGMEMLACPNLAVSPEVMQHIVHVESSANPYAIGVVGGQLERQPRNLPEALATVQMLDARGYNFSVGLAQVNRANLGRYGLDSYAKAFDTCANLSAGAHILADCYASAHGDWGKAFSCYYSGNFTTGFRDGYVQKVYALIDSAADNPGKATSVPAPAIPAIPLRAQPVPAKAAGTPTRIASLAPVTVHASGADYRVALRSMAIDAAAAATVPAIVAALGHASPASPPTPDGVSDSPVDANAAPLAGTTPPPALPDANAADDSVFVPEVRGPNDPPGMASASAATRTPATRANTDQADLRQEQRDAAFVF